jgi:protein TonB
MKDLPPIHPVYPEPQLKNLRNPLPTTPVPSTKVAKEEPAYHETDTIKSPPEKPPVFEERMTTDVPVLSVTAAPLTGRQHNLENAPEISAASDTGSEHATDGGIGSKTGAGHGSGAGTGQAGSGSPVETPFAYGTNPPPPYPGTARRRGWEGEVLLLVEVSAKGEVRKITVRSSSGYRILDRAALNAVYRWQFQAARRNGRAVAGKVMVPIRFSIKETK